MEVSRCSEQGCSWLEATDRRLGGGGQRPGRCARRVRDNGKLPRLSQQRRAPVLAQAPTGPGLTTPAAQGRGRRGTQTAAAWRRPAACRGGAPSSGPCRTTAAAGWPHGPAPAPAPAGSSAAARERVGRMLRETRHDAILWRRWLRECKAQRLACRCMVAPPQYAEPSLSPEAQLNSAPPTRPPARAGG